MQKGKCHTEEAKEKNRQAHLGNVPWNKGLKGLSNGWEKGKKRLGQIGENNYKWMGCNVGYRALHCWINKKKVKLNNVPCVGRMGIEYIGQI